METCMGRCMYYIIRSSILCNRKLWRIRRFTSNLPKYYPLIVCNIWANLKAVCQSFLRQMQISLLFTKAFSCQNFLLYTTRNVWYCTIWLKTWVSFTVLSRVHIIMYSFILHWIPHQSNHISSFLNCNVGRLTAKASTYTIHITANPL